MSVSLLADPTPIQRFILTGAPGAGKTTLLLKLEQLGARIVREAASDVIALARVNGNLTPWDNLKLFQSNILGLQTLRQAETAQSEKKVVFFDRSPFDTLAYCEQGNIGPSQELQEEINRIAVTKFYQKRVFLVQNLGFCEQTAGRIETQPEALVLEEMQEKHYLLQRFRVIKVAKGSVQERAERVMREVLDGMPPYSL